MEKAEASSDLPAMTPQQAKFASGGESAFKKYKDLAVGDASLAVFIWYELLTLGISGLPGVLGMGLRAALYPTLLGACAGKLAMGRGVVLRNPGKTFLGRSVLIDDYAALDVRGPGSKIELADCVSIGRFSTVAAKGGVVSLGRGVNIGSYCRIATQSRISFGESVLVAAYCYIGPGNHQAGDGETPLIAREMDIKGGVEIGSHAWIGAHSTILDGVKIGSGAIIGAHSLVKDDVPAGAVAAGSPARIISQR